MSILKRAIVLVRAPLEALFDFTSDHKPFPLYVFKKGIIPGVVRTETLEGLESGAGSKIWV